VYTYRGLLILIMLFATLANAGPQQDPKVLNQRGLDAFGRRDYAEAEKNYRQAAEMYRAFGTQFEPHLSIELFNLAEAVCGQGRWRESEPLFEESLSLSQRTLGPQHLRTISEMSALANVTMMLGDAPRAKALLTEAVVIARANYPGDLQLARILAGLAVLSLRAGSPDEALPFADEALSIALKAEGGEGPESAALYQNVAQVHQYAHRLDLALPLFRKARAILERLGKTNDPKYASLLSQEGLALLDDGKLGLAESGMRRAIELLSKPPVAVTELAVAQNNLGLLRMQQKKYAEADELLTKALSGEQDAAQISQTQAALAKLRSALR
jgi:tetratricopeptide (TPR) repeat protein